MLIIPCIVRKGISEMADNKSKYQLVGCFAMLCMVVVLGLILLGVMEALTWFICLGFGLEWTPLLGVAVWSVIALMYIVSRILL